MSKKEKSSFVFYYEWEQCFQALTNAELGRLLRVILAYEIRGERPEKLPGKLLICFDFVRGALDRNREKYEETCRRNRRNIGKRWHTKNTTGKNGIAYLLTRTGAGWPP